MASDLHMIAVDQDTAALVEKRAGERGLTAAQFISALVHGARETAQGDVVRPVDPDDTAVLAHRWAAVESGETPAISHDEVRRRLGTWGTSSFTAWSKPARRRLRMFFPEHA